MHPLRRDLSPSLLQDWGEPCRVGVRKAREHGRVAAVVVGHVVRRRRVREQVVADLERHLENERGTVLPKPSEHFASNLERRRTVACPDFDAREGRWQLDVRSVACNGHHIRVMNASPNRLDRFLTAQSTDSAVALAELERGRKRSHWMWDVLPQLRGLGMSAMSHTYGIAGLVEAEAYLAHPVLGQRLRECVVAICAHTDTSAADILGDIDAQKFRSCLTLFAAAAKHDDLFDGALHQFFGGRPDPKTLDLLASPRGEA